jgi:hypothetical protein
MANICTTFWILDHAFELVPAQGFAAQYLVTFMDYPQQKMAAITTWMKFFRS